MNKEKILVSSCLLGYPVRYDGKGQCHEDVLKLQEHYELIPFCPEMAGGLPTPRVPAEIIGVQVINEEGNDVTAAYKKGAERALELCLSLGISKAVLKSRSPSCGKDSVYDGTYSRTLKKGHGVAAKSLLDQGITVYSEENLGGLLP